MLTRIKVWRLRGSLSPEWTLTAWRVVKWGLGALPVGALIKSASDRWTTGSASAWISTALGWLHYPWTVPALLGFILLLAYLWWASSDATARLELLKLCIPGEKAERGLALTADGLVSNDLLPQRRWIDPTPDFLPRLVRVYRDVAGEKPQEFDGVQAILNCWKSGKQPVAVLGAAAIGKTRLVCEAIKRWSPTTLVVAPSQKGVDAQTEQLRYLRKKRVVIVFDDLNYYAKQDVAGFAARVAFVTEQNLVVAATCTVASLSTVNNDAVPQLRDYFASMKQLELLQMSAEQMSFLKKNYQKTSEHDYAGNPGMLLFNLDSMHAAYRALPNERRDVLQAIALLFWVNALPIQNDLLLSVTNRLYGRTMDMAALRGILDVLKDVYFVRHVDPIEPEEAYLDAVVNHRDKLLGRASDVEKILVERHDADALFLLAVGYLFRKEFEAALRVMAVAADLHRAAGSLVKMTIALVNRGVAVEAAGRPLEEIERVFLEAAEAGRNAAAPEGLAQTARALTNLGDTLLLAERPIADWERAYEEAAAAGRQAATSEGFAMAARALFNLGVARGKINRDLEEVVSAYERASEAGKQAATAEGLALAARASFNFGGILWSADRPITEIARAYRAAIHLGHQAGTLSGLADAAMASLNLGQALRQAGRPVSEVTNAFRGAADAWRKLRAPAGLVEAAKALRGVGVVLSDEDRPLAEIEEAYRAAAEAGQQSDSPEGLAEAAESLFNLGVVFMLAGRPRKTVENSYREAAQAGLQAMTPKGYYVAARALMNLGKYLGEIHDWRRLGIRPTNIAVGIALFFVNLVYQVVQKHRVRRRLPELRNVSLAVVEAGRKAGTPRGLEIAASALLNFGKSLHDVGRPLSELEEAYRKAGDVGRQAATPDGFDTAAKALFNLGASLSELGRPHSEIVSAYRDAAEAGRQAGTPDGLRIAQDTAFLISSSVGVG